MTRLERWHTMRRTGRSNTMAVLRVRSLVTSVSPAGAPIEGNYDNAEVSRPISC